ncbi:PKD domain-containing protein [Pseudoalteromonas sp. MMG022]|uniref:PKD domain-containing protein n=1 Tax=Pseudoalteromonas sp. MMG022 TaxID=2909978 RepID=UPI001F1F68EA|nr:PKD domain-containing protein [Pseudoalteromonas sp. MMG022]MCF6436392.1 PKD domain-containing protein [Pseudoalteromonas sp. MMG022]
MIWKNSFPIPLCILISACGGSGSTEVQAETNSAAKNQAPIAVITSSDTTITKNKLVHFNASKSYDPDGDALSYEWTLTKGAERTPVAIDVHNKEEIAVQLNTADKYVLTLTASDGKAYSKPSSFEFVLNDDMNLVASAGQDITVKKGQIVSLDGSESRDLDGVITGYQWRIIEKPESSQAKIFKDRKVKTTFVADQVGQFVVELSVQNDQGDIATDTLTVTSDALGVNSTPVVVLKNLETQLKPNEVIVLDASESYDPDRFDNLSFAWEVVSQPAGASANLSTLFDAQTSFSAETLGDYEVQVSVTDSQGASAQASYLLSVTTDNLPPVAQLGEDIHAPVAPLELVCKSCFDPEGEPLTYQWQLLSRPQQSVAQLQAATEAVAKLHPDVAGEYAVAVSVSDGQTEVTSNTQTYYIDANQQPTAHLTAPDVAYIGNTVELDASQSSDPNNDTLTYEWQLIESAAQVQLHTRDDGTAYFTPTELGNYIVSLRVHDGQYYSDPLTHTVQVQANLPPVIVLADDSAREVEVGAQVLFNASASYDPEGDALSYQWSLVKPEDSTAQLTTDASDSTSLVVDVAGTYAINLHLSDSIGNSSSKTVRVDVSDPVNMLTGYVRGTVVNSYKHPVADAGFMINGKQYVSDAQGVLNAQVEVEEGAALVIKTEDERLASGTYTAPSVTQDGFVINFGEAFVPNMQPIEVRLFTCPQYSGPDVIEVGYRMYSTVPEMGSITSEYDQKISFTLDSLSRSTQAFSLPATAKYELYVDDNLKITSPSSQLMNVYYSVDIPSRGFVTICNQ